MRACKRGILPPMGAIDHEAFFAIARSHVRVRRRPSGCAVGLFEAGTRRASACRGATAPAAEDALAAASTASRAAPKTKSRDQYRHPQEALAFWGLQPGMTILEVQPGGGWWTEILAPYAHATGGKYYATAADLDNPELSEGARKARADFEARFAAKPEVYGQVQLVNFGAKSKPLPENTFDFALSARSVHGWMGNGLTEKVLKDLYGALKPGGILAIEQHRANPGEQDPKAASGYVTEAYVIEQAQKAGFELVDRSEINANPADTEGPSVRRVDAAAHQAHASVQRRPGRARSEVRSHQVRRDRRVGPHDAEVPQAAGGQHLTAESRCANEIVGAT